MSGRTTDLKTYHDFPEAEKWLMRRKNHNTSENAKQARIALEQLDAFLYTYVLELDELTNTDLKDFSYFLSDEDYGGLAHSTVAKRWYAVRQYLNDHIDPELGWQEKGYILHWLQKGTETAHQEGPRIHWLPLDKIPKLIEGASRHPMTPLRNEIVVRLLWNTGCRPSEICSINQQDVELENRMIYVQNSKVDDSGADNFEKKVFFTRATRRKLKEWMNRGGRSSLPYSEETDKLIVGYNTPEISPRQVNKIVRLAAEEAGIQENTIERADGVSNKRVTPKALRHSFAVHSVRGMERSGSPQMDLETLRAILGHSSLDTVRHYLHFTDRGMKKSFDDTFPDRG
ncbi:tyrosine-type recombinase/integrase [Haloarcula brevis]|uniref:tyrosine-type recombinase/integrase n=1 Tax=Haloarcula brevis TaxID=3111453 RepID=UPI00300F018F